MKVVILCGGQGTRLKEETEFRPKPMVEIGGRPILWHIMKLYAHYGFREFILCLGFKGNAIKDYFLNYDYLSSDITVQMGRRKGVTVHSGASCEDWSVTLADTGLTTSTGGRVKQVEKYIDEPEFCLTYGDGLADINLQALVDFHRTKDRIATITGLRPESRFGVLETDEDSTVVMFREKPKLDGLISGGFFVFKREVFDWLDDDDDCVLEQTPMRKLATAGQMAAYQHNGFWKSMDTYRDYIEFNDLWDRGETQWTVWR